ncbi:hypothetical protein ACJBU6_02873 [Exserohilum turcicum]
MSRDNRSPEVLAVAILFFVLTWVAVCVRFYVRAGLTRTWGYDDSYMVAALCTFTVYLVCQIVAAVHGAGRHQAYLSHSDTRTALLFLYLCELGYAVTNCLVKFAIGSLYRRVAVKRWHIWSIWVLMVTTFVCSLVHSFQVMLQCAPISVFWNQQPVSPKCMDKGLTLGVRYTLASANAMTDWALGLLAVCMLWHVEMERRTRIFVAGILAFATIGCASTIMRMCYMHTIVNGNDFLYATTDIGIWSTVEPGIGIIAGSIATSQPLIRRLICCRESVQALRQDSLPQYHLTKATHSPSNSHSYQPSLALSDLGPMELNFITSHIPGLGSVDAESKLESSRDVAEDMELPCTKHEPMMQQGPPKLELRKSFRNSFNGGSLASSFAKVYIPQ